MGAGAYHAETTEMGTVVKAVEDVGSSFLSTTRDLEGLVLDALSFAGIGSGVAAANSALHSSLGSALQKFLSLITNVNQNVQTAANGYNAADTDVAQAYGGGQNAAQGGGGERRPRRRRRSSTPASSTRSCAPKARRGSRAGCPRPTASARTCTTATTGSWPRGSSTASAAPRSARSSRT